MASMAKKKGSNKISTSRSGYLFANNYKGVTVYKNPEDNMYAGYLQAALSRLQDPNKPNLYNNDGIPFNHAPRFAADFSLSQNSPGPVYLPTNYTYASDAGKWSFAGGPSSRDGFVFGSIHKGVAAPANKSKSTSENISPADYDGHIAKDKIMSKPVNVTWSKSTTRRFPKQANSYDISPGPKYYPQRQNVSQAASFGPKPQKRTKKQQEQRKQAVQEHNNKRYGLKQRGEKHDLTEEEREEIRDQNRAQRKQARQLKELNRWLKRTTWGGRLPRSIWHGKKYSNEAKGLESPGPIYSLPTDNWKVKNTSKRLQRQLAVSVWR